MRFKKGSIALAAIAACGLASLSTPTANAIDVSLYYGMCVVEFNEQELANIEVITENLRIFYLEALKEELPAVSAEIDKLKEDSFGGEGALETIEAEAIAQGFEPGIVGDMLVVVTVQPTTLFMPGISGSYPVTAREKLALVESLNLLDEGAMTTEASKALAKKVNDSAEWSAIVNAFKDSLQACANASGGGFGSSSFGSS